VSQVARVLIYREFGRTALPFEPPSIPAAIAGSPYARGLASGELSLALVFGEVHRTGDLSDVGASYRETHDGYLISVSRISVVGGASDFFIVPAKEPASGKIGLFLLENGLPTVTIEQEAELTADESMAQLTAQESRLDKDRLLGGEIETLRIIAREQLRLAARSLGIGHRCLQDSLEHARNRVTFGAPLSSRQAIQWMIADVSVKLRAATWLTLEAAWRVDQGLPHYGQAALAKKMATRMAFEAADMAIQIHGGYGVCKEFPFESFYREARLMRLLYGREAEIDRTMGEKFFRTE